MFGSLVGQGISDIIRQLDKIGQGYSQLPIIHTGLINVSTHFWIIQYTYFSTNRFENFGIVQYIKLKTKGYFPNSTYNRMSTYNGKLRVLGWQKIAKTLGYS